MMTMDKLEHFVTVDEAQVPLVKDNQRTKHCYLKRSQELPDKSHEVSHADQGNLHRTLYGRWRNNR